MAPRQKHNTSVETHAVMVALVKSGGKTHAEVAKLFKVGWDTVDRAVKHANFSASNQDLPHSGRPKVTMKRTDCAIKIMSLSNHKLTATAIHSELASTVKTLPSVSTIKWRLFSRGLHGCVAQKMPLL